MITRALISLLLIASICGCRKADPLEPQALATFRSYEMNTYRARETPDNGFVLLGIETEQNPLLPTQFLSLDFAQFLDENGEPTSRFDFSSLPNEVDGRTFDADHRYISDIVPWPDGTMTLIGISREEVTEDSMLLYLVAYDVDRLGNLASAPMSRLLCLDGALSFTGAPFRDPMPIPRAYGEVTPQGELVIAAYYSGYSIGSPHSRGFLSVYRFPSAGSGLPEAVWNLPEMTSTLGGLWHFKQSGSLNERMLIVLDRQLNDALMVELDVTGTEILETGRTELSVAERTLPYFLTDLHRQNIVGGSVLVGLQAGVGSFITPIGPTLGPDLNDSYRMLQSINPPPTFTQSYAGCQWKGQLAVLVNTYPSNSQAPFFVYDAISDLDILFVDPISGLSTGHQSIARGKGLTPLQAFEQGNDLVCIGTRNAYGNPVKDHTFFMRISSVVE